MAHHLRRIHPDELPQVRDDETLALRPATPAELLNFGLVPLGADLYDAAHVDGDPEPPWGVRVIAGPRAVRYGRLPEVVGRKVLRARVLRAPGHALGASPERLRAHLERRAARGRPSRIRAQEVRMEEVQGGDVVERSNIIPVRWAGERD